jgi:hypothetical protein
MANEGIPVDKDSRMEPVWRWRCSGKVRQIAAREAGRLKLTLSSQTSGQFPESS